MSDEATSTTDFPAGFLWGSSTAAHQVEGGNTNNDWWQWEHTPGSTAVESSADGIDHWHRFDADFALLGALGQNAHRFSVEWSIIEPAKGEFCRAALDHYARVLESLACHGLTACATLYHFTLPQWFAARGGWLARDALDIFGHYADKVATTLGDLIPYACTVNEPQIVAIAGFAGGYFPPGHRDLDEARRVNTVLAQAHRVAPASSRCGRKVPTIGPPRTWRGNLWWMTTSAIYAPAATSVTSSACSTTPASCLTRPTRCSSLLQQKTPRQPRWAGRSIPRGSGACCAASPTPDCR